MINNVSKKLFGKHFSIELGNENIKKIALAINIEHFLLKYNTRLLKIINTFLVHKQCNRDKGVITYKNYTKF